jgi:hypothetical protein
MEECMRILDKHDAYRYAQPQLSLLQTREGDWYKSELKS